MNIKTIKESMRVAKEFIDCGTKVLEESKEYNYEFMCGTRKTGALRRKSMDLTNALVDMRKNG